MKQEIGFLKALSGLSLLFWFWAATAHADLPAPIEPGAGEITSLIRIGIGVGVMALVAGLVILALRRKKDVADK